MQTRQWLGLVTGLAGLMWTAEASAQNVAAAIEIFNRARAEYDRKDFVAACPDFAESQRLAPHPSTLFWLAKCEDDAGLIASASGHYLEFLAEFRALSDEKQVKYQERAVDAEQRRATLAPDIPTLTLKLPANAPEHVEILHHETHVSAAMLGLPLPVDPGEHVVTTQVPNGPVHEHRFVIERNDKKEIILVVDVPPPPPVSLVGKTNVREQPSSARTGGLALLGPRALNWCRWWILPRRRQGRRLTRMRFPILRPRDFGQVRFGRPAPPVRGSSTSTSATRTATL